MTIISSEISRRQFVTGAAALGAASSLGVAGAARAATVDDYIAKPPKGFSPLAIPGKVVKVTKGNDFASLMQPNQLWPKSKVARAMLERAMTEFTGAPNMVEAMKKFIHKDDVVAIKPNGIAGQKGYTMAVNFELILPVVESLLKIGVPAEKITVYEQFPSFFNGTRVNVKHWKLPEGIQTGTHNNRDHVMPKVRLFHHIPTHYCRFFTDATAVIDMTMIKDHSICGYTGCLKNITHGNVNNPEAHHGHNASPQIAMLHNHPVVTSRVRLHITDAYKVMYDKGPLDRDPNTRIPHGAVYVSTDPVAMDTVGWRVVEEERKKRGLKTLKRAKREPRYIQTASEFGLGVHNWNDIRLQEVAI